MNTGIGDAVDLGWKFAAVLQGWGGAKLLSSIESERRPVAVANCDAAGANMGIRFGIAEAYTPLVHENSTEGAAARAAWGARIVELGNEENESLGLELDYRYRESPVICREDGEQEWHKLRYRPTTLPGVRAPHVFLEDRRAIFDLFGQWFTLLRFNTAVDIEPMVRAAAQRKVPLKVVDISDQNARAIYERDLVLIRPDQHVAWRAAAVPADALAVIDRVRGA
jgi:hypothetical protein